MKILCTIFLFLLSFGAFAQVDIINNLEVKNGVITLESVEKTTPGIVFSTPTGKQFSYIDLIPYIIKAIQEISSDGVGGNVIPQGYEMSGGNVTFYIKPKKEKQNGKDKKKEKDRQ